MWVGIRFGIRFSASPSSEFMHKVAELIKGSQYLEQGFGAHYTIIIVGSPRNSIGNYLGPYEYSSLLKPKCRTPNPAP